jgi:hypothetical protein
MAVIYGLLQHYLLTEDQTKEFSIIGNPFKVTNKNWVLILLNQWKKRKWRECIMRDANEFTTDDLILISYNRYAHQ